MRPATFLVVVAALMGGCAFDQIETGMNALIGQPVERLFAYIGYPDGETTVAGHRLLIYNNRQSVTLPTTNTAQTSGSIYSDGGYATYTGTTTYSSTATYNYSCELRVEIDQNNVIQNYSFYGNLGGCQRYANVVKATDEIRASDSTQYDLASTWTNDARQFARWKEASAAARERCGHVCYEEINACMKYSSVDGAVRCLDLIAAE